MDDHKKTTEQKENNFQILSLSGGGFLGLYAISVIEKIEESLGDKRIAQYFDLIAGTSIGGIVALALAAEVPAKTIREAFEKNGEKIFPDHCKIFGLKKCINFLRNIFLPKYSDRALRSVIESLIRTDTKIGDLKHPVIIPAINLTKGSPQVFKTSHHQNFKNDLKLSVVEVALATSAAPTYFPLAEINDQLFADGGLYLNSPDLAALHEAEFFFGCKTESIKMLSIGTTTAQFSLSHKTGKNLGIYQWMKGDGRLIRTIISSQQLYSDFMLKHKLKTNHIRIDHTQSREQERDLGLDIATLDAKKTIKGLAEGSYQNIVNNHAFQQILSHQKPEPIFYNKNK